MIGSRRAGGGSSRDGRRSNNPRPHGDLGAREHDDRNGARPTTSVASSGARRPTLPRGRRRLRHKQPQIALTRSAAGTAVHADLPLAIEDYALIGDCTSAALVGRNGSIDWLCWPRFDSSACFTALLGTSDHGRWRIHPADPAPHVSRAYRDGTMVLETVFSTKEGRVAVIDFMPPGHGNSSVVRLVEGRAGKVTVRLHLKLRFDYGSSVPGSPGSKT
ncbi:MAG TPA: trehalase-like domain-containing protein, partial [Candidatus Acidoferrales bacterium]|nr:trehalase-like domain-containing protein [Candidatus Acidoferrales bacterium]